MVFNTPLSYKIVMYLLRNRSVHSRKVQGLTVSIALLESKDEIAVTTEILPLISTPGQNLS